MTARLAALRARLNIEPDMPLVAVPVADAAQADTVRHAGGLALPPLASCTSKAEPSVDNVIAFDADAVAPDGLRAAYPDAVLLDCGHARDKDAALALCAQGVDGISVGSLGYGDNGGTPGDRDLIYAFQCGDDGPAPVVSGGMNAVRALGFFENLGHASVVLVVRRGVFDHADGLAAGVESLIQAAQCRRMGGNIAAFAQSHPAFARAFESFSSDADALYPGWRGQLGI